MIVHPIFDTLVFAHDEMGDAIYGTQITANNNEYRYLVFNTPRGRVATRVHGNSSSTIPSMTTDMDFTFATRSVLRGLNLLVLRGSQTNTHMIGPCDFYGPLEKPHLYLYTIVIEGGFPRFYRVKKQAHSPILAENILIVSTELDAYSAKINATWFSGKHPYIEKIKDTYSCNKGGESLFPTLSGILLIHQQSVELPEFDARAFDLSSFKARLVRNDIPFSIAEEVISRKDSFCPVSYFFESGYADEQVSNAGGGLFLETHDFCQTITPLDAMAGGIVMLGRWAEEERNQSTLSLIGVTVPYGYTLIVEKGCIHGDTTLKGMYMMAMTSNHVTMQTADVVFLKSKVGGKNFLINTSNDNDNNISLCDAPLPIVDFGQFQEEGAAFDRRVNNGWPIYNPVSRILNPYFGS